LKGFANIMLLLPCGLSLLVASKPRDSCAHRASYSIRNALSKVTELTLSFLCLAFTVLLDSLLLEALRANEASKGLLRCADGLVP
jgi:hypothetical protein